MIELVTLLIDRRPLSPTQVAGLIQEMLTGEADDMQIAAALVAWRAKGETGPELAAAADYLRRHMVRLSCDRLGILDTCGTGGDESGTFNISTATALVAAAAGVPVVKHGNRAISSRSGSVDVLGALGVPVEVDVDRSRKCLNEIGITFCYAPRFHPALKQVANVRKRLGFRTVFNFLGPLLNPAEASNQLIGVGQPDVLDPLAEALATLGTDRSFLVHGKDGLDEVTLTGPTEVRLVQGNLITALQWTPEDFGLPRCTLADLRASNPEESAAQVMGILEGRPGPRADIVAANAAAAFVAVGRAPTLKEGVALARTVLANGQALQILERLVAFLRD